MPPPHQGGQAPLFALPQTLATSPIVYFPNSALIDEKVNHQTTSASLFVPLSSGLESDGEDKILDPAYDRGDTFLEDGVADTSGPDLRNLFDLWVTAKARAATLSSLIFGLYQRSPSESIKPPVFTSPDEEIGHAAASQGSVDSWLSRKACGWIGLCNMAQNRNGPGDFVNRLAQGKAPWKGEKHQPGDWDGDGRVLGEIPSYVLEHAPYVHLFSNEQFWPCDMAVHLKHITPELNYTPIQASSEHPTLSNLDELNQWKQGLNVFLTSNDNVETDPDWLEGRVNIPQPIGPDGRPSQTKRWTGEDSDVFDDTGDSWLQKDDEFESQVDDGNLANRLKDHHSTNQRPKQGGKSEAPAVLIVVDKGQGIVDAFWFYFYSFNLGNGVFNIRFGSHVGDWEHTLVRFENGKPLTVFCSEHSFGEAFTYDAAEKIGKRPVVYSATGTHAMYSTPGVHDYVLPFGLLHDETDRGPLWDPVWNTQSYTYDYANDTLLASSLNPLAPTSWFYFAGKWGDKIYPLSDSRQYTFAGQWHYVNGPLGPRFKNLGRKNVCQGDSDPCVIKNVIGGEETALRWDGIGEGEEMNEQDYERFFGNGHP